MSFSVSKAVSGALLISGTAIGAGMLALPVVTGLGGFLPAMLLYFICWLFMACTGLLLLEVCLWMPNDANIITMSHHLLGPIGRACSWVLYLFLFYCCLLFFQFKILIFKLPELHQASDNNQQFIHRKRLSNIIVSPLFHGIHSGVN